jgi:hypothetical protein
MRLYAAKTRVLAPSGAEGFAAVTLRLILTIK